MAEDLIMSGDKSGGTSEDDNNDKDGGPSGASNASKRPSFSGLAQAVRTTTDAD